MNADVKALMSELKDGLQALYGKRLKGLYGQEGGRRGVSGTYW